MEEKTFTIKGTYKEKNAMKKFVKEVTAVNQNYAKEKVLSIIGSKHKARRNKVKIESLEEKK